MNRKIQPHIRKIKDLNICTPIRITLPNGIPLSIINAGEEDVVRIDIIFSGGRWHQSQKLQALFTNRMLREGTKKYSSAEIAEKLDYYGSWLELSTSSEYAFVTIYSLNKYVKETLSIVESMIKESIFPEQELKIILDTNIQQYRINSSKVEFLSQQGLLQTVYGSQHPCGQILSEDDYRNISSQVLQNFYEQYYHSQNCIIFLSGKITSEIIQQVIEHLGSSFGSKSIQKDYKKRFCLTPASDKRIFIENTNALQSSVKIGCATISQQHPDYLKIRVLITLLGGYFGSRLMSNIREKKGYTYGISAGIVPYPDNGLFLISTETANEYVAPLIKEVYHEIDRLHQELVAEDELTIVRNYMLGEMCRSYESPFSLADAWIFITTSKLDDDYFLRSVKVINEITPKEIQDLVQKYLCKENLKEVIAGKKLS